MVVSDANYECERHRKELCQFDKFADAPIKLNILQLLPISLDIENEIADAQLVARFPGLKLKNASIKYENGKTFFELTTVKCSYKTPLKMSCSHFKKSLSLDPLSFKFLENER